MPSQIVSPYRKHGETFYPTAPFEIRHLGNLVVTDALIDSGATLSIFRPEIADRLGIPIERGKKILIRGIAGDVIAYVHALRIRILEQDFEWNVAFCRNLGFSLNLMGRSGFFENHEVTFHEKEKQVVLKSE